MVRTSSPAGSPIPWSGRGALLCRAGAKRFEDNVPARMRGDPPSTAAVSHVARTNHPSVATKTMAYARGFARAAIATHHGVLRRAHCFRGDRPSACPAAAAFPPCWSKPTSVIIDRVRRRLTIRDPRCPEPCPSSSVLFVAATFRRGPSRASRLRLGLVAAAVWLACAHLRAAADHDPDRGLRPDSRLCLL